jgi:hypothetical protein
MGAILNFAEKYHIVGLTSPVDTGNTTVNSDIVNLGKNHSGCFLVYIGTITGDTAVITVEECDDTTPSDSTAIDFRYRESGATGTSDAFGDITAATTSGVTVAATDDDKIFLIEIDADELSDGYPYVRIVVDPGSSASACEVAIVAVLDGRFKQNDAPSALT